MAKKDIQKKDDLAVNEADAEAVKGGVHRQSHAEAHAEVNRKVRRSPGKNVRAR
jgi:hypothetical protein